MRSTIGALRQPTYAREPLMERRSSMWPRRRIDWRSSELRLA